MPSTRRLKTIAVILAVAICTIFYLTVRFSPLPSRTIANLPRAPQNDARRAASQEFYTNTVNALNAAERSVENKIPNLEDIKAAAKKGATPNREAGPAKPVRGQQAQAPLEVEVPKKVLDEDTGESSRKEEKDGDGKMVGGGPRKAKGGEKWDMATGKEAPLKAGKEEEDKEENKEEREVEAELNGILKKGPSMSYSFPLSLFHIVCGPFRSETWSIRRLIIVRTVIIFSKSYCPFSAKAKNILLKKYTIIPEPYVVELDQHPLGQGLQAHLAKSTGRRTVPNILIIGKSVGGGDEIAALDGSGGLIEKVKGMGGKRIMEAKLAS
jgi:glutaredoxin